MIREAVVAGQFYPSSPQDLKRQIGSMVDEKVSKEKAIAVVSPHAGYIYSGPVAAAVFSRVEITGTVIILGPNHTGTGSSFSLYREGCWRTPLGEVEIDSELAAEISESCSLIEADRKAHLREHSLEVQLPFMQYFKKDFKIVPIVVSQAESGAYKEIGEAIALSVKRQGEDALILASSDMTHYEPYQSAKDKDRIAIEAILSLDEKLLLEKVEEYDISMCGYVPTAIMLIAAKSLGAEKAKLVRYQTSADASGDYSAVVGYAGIIVK